MNPIDGFSYLAKMRQGYDGSWLMRLPYAADPGSGAFLFVYHLFLGHLARWTGAELLLVYHAARMLAAWAMFSGAYFFFEVVLLKAVQRWAAFLFVLLGSGLGWIASAFGIFANDLWVPESIPFLSAYANPHFPIAAALLLWGMRYFLRQASSGLVIPALLGFGLALIQPFAIVIQVGTLVSWGIIESRLVPSRLPFRPRDLAAFSIGSLPLLGYYLWLTTNHAVLSLWSEQNLTPTPPPFETALGFGLVLVLAAIGTMRSRAYTHQHGRLLAIWVVLGFVLMYLPFALQRRMVFGLFFPLAALAGIGFHGLFGTSKRFRLALTAALILMIPSNVVVIAAGVTSARREQSVLLMAADDRAAYDWISQNLAPDALVLASPESGNRIPAFASVRVLYGHPFETPRADHQRDLVEQLYRSGDVNRLRLLGIDYVLLGSSERALGSTAWIDQLDSVYRAGSTQIFEVLR
jgi:hypothetical protein